MNRRVAVVVGVGIMLVLSLAPWTRSASQGLPVHGKFKGTLEREQVSTAPPAWDIVLTGRLQVAGLGVGTARVTYDGVQLGPEGNNLVGTEAGEGVFTFRSGDQAFGAIRWLTTPTRDPDVLTIVGTLAVTGGTGVFAEATGHGIAVGQGRVSTGEVTFEIDGFLKGVRLRR